MEIEAELRNVAGGERANANEIGERFDAMGEEGVWAVMVMLGWKENSKAAELLKKWSPIVQDVDGIGKGGGVKVTVVSLRDSLSDQVGDEHVALEQ